MSFHSFLRRLILSCMTMGMVCFSTPILASGGGGHGKEKPAEKGHGGGGGHGGGENAPPEAPKASQGYVHHWIKMPAFSAANVLGTGSEEVAPRPGRALIIFFLASWCEPCQEIVGEARRLEQRYKGLAADFVYVFAHDTREDAGGFLREHQMPRGVLANHDVLKEYHNPELPSIYVGDRDGWLLTRYIKVSRKDLDELDGLLRNLTAY